MPNFNNNIPMAPFIDKSLWQDPTRVADISIENHLNICKWIDRKKIKGISYHLSDSIRMIGM